LDDFGGWHGVDFDTDAGPGGGQTAFRMTVRSELWHRHGLWHQIKRSSMDIDVDLVTTAMKDVLAGHEMKLTEQQSQEAIRTITGVPQEDSGEEQKGR